MSVSDIINFIQIDERTATGGMPTEAQLRAARVDGYEVVINLTPGGQAPSLPDEAELLSGLGIEYHHIPVPWDAPGLDQFHAFERAMGMAGDRRTLIHCQANFRVTAFYAVYAFAHRGWNQQQADALIDRVWKSRPGYTMDEVWRSFIATARAATHNENGPPRG